MMKSNILKILIAAGTLCSLLASAQTTAPNATVVDGNLVLNPGTNEETTIEVPAGEIVDGDLVIGGVTISKPNAQVQNDGSLYLPDEQKTFTVPGLPVSMFFQDLYEYTNPEQAGWYYSPVINHFWSGESIGNNGWIFWQDWAGIDQANAWFYVNTTYGNGEGFWAFSNYMESWCFFWVGDGGFRKLGGAEEFQYGWFYVDNPPNGGSNFYFYDQYAADWAGGAKVGLISNDNGVTWTQIN